MATAFELQVRVYLEDTDAQGIVYHTGYLRFFERARTEALRALDCAHSELMERDLAFVARHMQVDFLRPGHLDEELRILSSIRVDSGVRFTFDQQAMNPRDELLCRAQIQCACIRLSSGGPVRLPRYLASRLTADS